MEQEIEVWGDRYTAHDGSAGCPVDPSEMIVALYRSGTTEADHAGDFDWQHRGNEDDIIGWRERRKPAEDHSIGF